MREQKDSFISGMSPRNRKILMWTGALAALLLVFALFALLNGNDSDVDIVSDPSVSSPEVAPRDETLPDEVPEQSTPVDPGEGGGEGNETPEEENNPQPEPELSENPRQDGAQGNENDFTRGEDKDKIRIIELLNGLDVKDKAPGDGYDRDEMYGDWADFDGDGCDASEEAIIAYAMEVNKGNGCKILAARLMDPYSGEERMWSGSRAGIVDIDHIVALKNTWQTGAFQWDQEKRVQVANDPLNLVPADARLNRQKGDKDASKEPEGWLPPNEAYQCTYVSTQVLVKSKYGLWVTPSEKASMLEVLNGCGDKINVAGDLNAFAVENNFNEPAPVQEEPAQTNPSQDAVEPAAPVEEPIAPVEEPVAEKRWSTCKEAKADGAGPFHRGEPEYEWFRDGDNDGVVCES